jgi:hypothetical protein
MTSRKFIAVLATVVIILAAFVVTRRNAPETDITKASLYPELIEQINEVDKIEIRSAEQQSVLARRDGAWVQQNRDGFPARFNDVKRTLIQLAELRVLETKTSRPEKYPRLGVQDVDADESTSKSVTVSGASGESLVSLIVGNARKGGAAATSGHYVRRSDEAHALLVEGDLELPADPNEWVDTQIADIPTNRVHLVRITPHEGQAVEIHKGSPEENFFHLDNMPEGYTEKSKAAVSSLGAILLDLRFTDVAADATIGADIVPAAIIQVLTYDGLIAKIEKLDYEGKVYARFRYEFNPDAITEIASGHASEEAAADEADEAAPADTETAADPDAEGQDPEAGPSVEEQARALNETARGWVFVLPDYKARMMDKKLDDLIKVYEPPPPPLEPDEPVEPDQTE